MSFAAVSVIETPAEIAEGKRRPRHEALDALYFFRPTTFNLERICGDYEVEVEKDTRDIFERCMPCIFRGIGGVAPEPAWYADWRMLVLPSMPRKDAGPYDYVTARNWLDSQMQARSAELARLPRCVPSPPLATSSRAPGACGAALSACARGAHAFPPPPAPVVVPAPSAAR